jgi:hypothetical protein
MGREGAASSASKFDVGPLVAIRALADELIRAINL